MTIGPDVDTWAESYDAPAVTYDGDVAVGTALPEDVQIVEVPKHKDLGFVRLGKKRVVVLELIAEERKGIDEGAPAHNISARPCEIRSSVAKF